MTRKVYLLWLIGILVLTSLGYIGTYGADFVYEDGNATGFASTQPMPIAPTRVRALTRISYRIDRAIGGGGPRAYHMTNVGIHLANGLLVGEIAAELVSPAGALLAVGLFLWHPLQTEAVSYIAGRTEVLSTFWVLVACVLTLLGGQTRGWLVAIGACLLLAMAAKESAVCGIGLVLLCGKYRSDGWEWLELVVSRYKRWLVPFGALTLGLCTTVWWYEYRPIGFSPLGRWHYAALQATAVWTYVTMIPYPWGQTVDHDFELMPLAVQGVALAGLVAVYLTVWWSGNRRWIFCANWMGISVALRFVVRIPETLNEHQIYLWWVGVSIGIVVLVEWIEQALARFVARVLAPMNPYGELDFGYD